MAVSDRKIYEFSDFRLIPEDSVLLRNGKRVPLPPKAFSTLLLLVENHGHLVLKDELVETIWADVYVDEAAVSRCVWTVRSALGETSKTQQFIQTIPKRGYQFVADVKVVYDTDGAVERHGSAVSANEFDHIDNTPYRRRFYEWQKYALVAVILIAAGAFVSYILYPWTKTSSEGGPVSIAILPFKSVENPGNDALYELGMTETLISKLSNAENFNVRSLDSVRRYIDTDITAIAAGNEQRVDYVLAPTYQVVDGKIRVTAQLVNVGAGKTVEEYEFLTEVPDSFTAQDSVANELKERLAARFGDRSAGLSIERGTKNEEAYRHYLLAKNFNELRGPENSRIALEHIDRALALDPQFARAWATKGYIHRYMGYREAAVENSLSSIGAIEKALSIDPNLPEAHSVLCFNKFRFEYDFSGAERACRRAIELDPAAPLARKIYANFLYTRGRFDDAISEIKKAIDLQPISYDNQQTYALALYFARRYAEAESQWKLLIPLNPDHNLIYVNLVRALVHQGKESEALEYMIRSLTLEKAGDETIQRFKFVFDRSGWRGVVLERIRLFESRKTPPSYDLARLYASIEDANNAFKYLELAHRERSNMIAVVGVDPELEPLRQDERYNEFIRKVEAGNR